MLEATDIGVEERWRALWESSPQRSPFSHLRFVRAIAGAAGLRTGVCFAAGSGRDTAGAAVTWRRRGPYREVIVPPFTPYSALLLGRMPSDADVHARKTPLDDLFELLEGAFHAVRLHLPPSLSDVRSAQWRGWSAHPLYTYRLSDADPGAWSASTARTYRSARDSYSLVQGAEAAGAAVQLAAGSYARHERALPLEEPALRSLVKSLSDAGIATVFGARNVETEEIDAAVVVARSLSCSYYWIAGSRPGDAMTVLIGMMLPRLFGSGTATFDFVGANTPGIAEFKRRFGADLVPYFRLEHYNRIDLKILYAFRKMMR